MGLNLTHILDAFRVHKMFHSCIILIIVIGSYLIQDKANCRVVLCEGISTLLVVNLRYFIDEVVILTICNYREFQIDILN